MVDKKKRAKLAYTTTEKCREGIADRGKTEEKKKEPAQWNDKIPFKNVSETRN